MNDPAGDHDGRVGLGWVAAGLAWRGIPELRHLPRSEARAIHFRAWRAAWGKPAMWAVMLGCAIAGMVLGGLVTSALRLASRTQWIVQMAVWLAVFCVGDLLLIGLVRRRVRAELGTHCPGCDYDLRGGHAVCPECGRAVEPKQAKRQGSHGAVGAREEDGNADGRG